MHVNKEKNIHDIVTKLCYISDYILINLSVSFNACW